ncbi:hypothetical protein Cni_G04119 [Canna indica]|uniref:Uncharacterized protein n=1 Tax=Canna indica TaxID=4628 RepID=A0AAQ3JSX7_9LILI|nr:hypothetical protein Cni_G04119 [Canna indica]
MEMKKIACAVLVAAASATGALAAEAPAPGPASASFAVTPAAGAAVGAALLSFVAFYLHQSPCFFSVKDAFDLAQTEILAKERKDAEDNCTEDVSIICGHKRAFDSGFFWWEV